jgi:glycosyltransferase involved in cell wall biosynthesis
MESGRPPKVSVVIASHNYGRFLPDALRSVQEQTFEDWECIVVDDASTDDTEAVAGRFVRGDSRIRYLRNPRNLGEAGSRNTGNRAARGEFISSLDADDWWHPDKLKRQLEAMQRVGGAVLAFGAAVMVTPGGEKLWEYTEGFVKHLDKGLHCECQIVHSSVLVRRDAVLAVGGYDEGLPTAPDWDIWLRILHRFGARSFVYAESPLVYYRFHGSNISSNWAKMIRAERIILRRSFFRGGWALRHPLAAWAAVNAQLHREVQRPRQAGHLWRAFRTACLMVALSPLRRWRWLQAARLYKELRCGVS